MNYFNYFTEVEEHFQKARATGLFLVSPLDWALIESWKESGIPLEAVLKGIDRAFEKWHARKRRTKQVNSLAYCAQEVLTAAREMAEGIDAPESREPEAPFDKAELARYFRSNAALIRQQAIGAPPESATTYAETITALEQMAEAAESGNTLDLQAIEQRLTVLEERLIAAATQQLSEEHMLEARQEMERSLAPYRGKMTGDQIRSLEKQFLARRSLEEAGLPRLSLFYLPPQ